jgi:uncharacterized protein
MTGSGERTLARANGDKHKAAPAAGGGSDGEARKPVRVAALADLHVHKVHHGQYRALFAELSEKADVVALCGDLTNLGLPEEADNLAADLAALRIPAVAVLGNHDHQTGHGAEVKRVLERANVTFLEDESYEISGVGFAGVKGFGGGFGSHMLSSFGEDATKHFVTEALKECLQLENALRNLSTLRNVVVLHYAPIAETVNGEPPEIFPFLGCSRLAETIDRFSTVAAVFHGHAHHGTPEGRTGRGTPVYNVSVELLRNGAARGDVAAPRVPYIIIEV